MSRGKEVKPHDGTRTSVDEFMNEPDKLCAKFLIENDETMERVHYSIQVRPASERQQASQCVGCLRHYLYGSDLRGLCAHGFCAAQDTPGYGDDTDIDKSIRMIVDYVRKKNEDYFRMEKDYTRTESLSAREDPRVSTHSPCRTEGTIQHPRDCCTPHGFWVRPIRRGV